MKENKFSEHSLRALNSCAPPLRALFTEVLKYEDCKVLEGNRSKQRGRELKAAKKSKLGDRSKHCNKPSLAVDVAPFPVDWPGDEATEKQRMKSWARWYYFAGVVRTVAKQLGVQVRWGGDWDGDGNFSDQSFDDLVHWEIRG